MSWWGKLLGGTFGFMLGGPLGAILGASLGHNFDRGLGVFEDPDQNFGTVDVERIQSAFFTATFSVMGYVAKIDGRVTAAEIEVAESVMRQMNLNPQQKKVAISLFERGKQADFPLHEVLRQFRQECHRRRSLLQMFLEILIVTALSDGELQAPERRVLDGTAAALGFGPNEFQAILHRLQASRQMHGADQRDPETSLRDAYRLLGVERGASDEELKRAYRRLMNQHHPDKLVAKGLPREMMDLAHQKTLEIKAAYDLIRKSTQ